MICSSKEWDTCREERLGWEGYLYYITKEACEEVKEEEAILYEDTDKLVNKIKELME